MTHRALTDAERIVGLREAIEAARGDWHEATALLSVGRDLDWLLARSVPAPTVDAAALDAALTRDNRWSRWHEEQVSPTHRRSWACIPLTDAIEAALRASAPGDEG